MDPQFEDLEETEEQEQDERQYEAQDKYNLKVAAVSFFISLDLQRNKKICVFVSVI